jgi:uncharacterized protein YrrD
VTHQDNRIVLNRSVRRDTNMDTSHSTPSPAAPDQVHARDPHVYLRTDMRVKGEQGKRLGTVVAVEHDATGVLTGITMSHGLLARKRTRIPVERIKQVNQDAVVIEYSASSLNRLARMPRP